MIMKSNPNVNYIVPLSKEQFEQSVSRWIHEATGEDEYYRCGFCDAIDTANESLPETEMYDCRNCALNPKYCGFDIGIESAYVRWDRAETVEVQRQAALELLEGLYDYGVAHGYIDPAVDNLASSGIVELYVAVEPICGAGVKAEW